MSTKMIDMVHTIIHEKPTRMSDDSGDTVDSPTPDDSERFSELHIVDCLITLSLGIRSTPVDYCAAVHPMFALWTRFLVEEDNTQGMECSTRDMWKVPIDHPPHPMPKVFRQYLKMGELNIQLYIVRYKPSHDTRRMHVGVVLDGPASEAHA